MKLLTEERRKRVTVRFLAKTVTPSFTDESRKRVLRWKVKCLGTCESNAEFHEVQRIGSHFACDCPGGVHGWNCQHIKAVWKANTSYPVFYKTLDEAKRSHRKLYKFTVPKYTVYVSVRRK